MHQRRPLSLTGMSVHDGSVPVPDDSSVSADVAAWFEARGFRLSSSDVDYSDEVRSSPWGRKAPSQDDHGEGHR